MFFFVFVFINIILKCFYYNFGKLRTWCINNLVICSWGLKFVFNDTFLNQCENETYFGIKQKCIAESSQTVSQFVAWQMWVVTLRFRLIQRVSQGLVIEMILFGGCGDSSLPTAILILTYFSFPSVKILLIMKRNRFHHHFISIANVIEQESECQARISKEKKKKIKWILITILRSIILSEYFFYFIS